MKELFEDKKFRSRALATIATANDIITEYQADGFTLTIRQLYYQFVARGYIENNLKSYKNLAGVINDGRVAGLIDWEGIEDRTRFLRSLAHWETGADIVRTCSYQFRVDSWGNQRYRPEVWIEKDALVGIIEGVCRDYDVPYFACRGYASQSELWRAGKRMARHVDRGQTPVVIHLGDHDPSGMDMTRDNADRLTMFARGRVEVIRVALNLDQVQQYDPPPNPAKLSDSRANDYIDKFGESSWELDALEPRVISKLIEAEILRMRDPELLIEQRESEALVKEELRNVVRDFEERGI